MKKIFYLLSAVILTCSLLACQDEPKNPGDFNIAPTLSAEKVVSFLTGDEYPINIINTTDTTILASGKKMVKSYADTIWLPVPADSFYIDVYSNAKWYAPVPQRIAGAKWYQNRGVTAGGGDGSVSFITLQNTTRTDRPYPFTLEIYSSDTTVWLSIPFRQYGPNSNK